MQAASTSSGSSRVFSSCGGSSDTGTFPSSSSGGGGNVPLATIEETDSDSEEYNYEKYHKPLKDLITDDEIRGIDRGWRSGTLKEEDFLAFMDRKKVNIDKGTTLLIKERQIDL